MQKIVRAHQLVNEGYKAHFEEKLITLWSAPNYCYRMNNLAAIMKLDEDLTADFYVYEASNKSKNSVDYAKLSPYFL